VAARITAILIGAATTRGADTLPTKSEVLDAMMLANNYFMAEWPAPGCAKCLPGSRPSNIWTRGVYFEGAMALYHTNHDDKVLNYATEWATFHDWSFRNGDATTNAD